MLREDVAAEILHVTGNTVIDALLDMVARFASDDRLRAGLERQFEFLNPKRKGVLVTGHQRESFGSGCEQICQTLRMLGERGYVDIEIAWAAERIVRICAAFDTGQRMGRPCTPIG